MYGVLATGAIAAAASAVAATADFRLSEYALPSGNAANFPVSPVVGVQRVGTTQSGGGGTSTSRMWTHVTLGGESPALTIALFYGDVRFEVSSITVDGADVSGWLALSALHATAPYGAVVYVVPGLEAGEHTISVTYAGAAENWYVSEETQNVHQTRPVRDADYNASTTDGSAQTPTITLDSSDADLMQIFGVRNSGSLTVPSDQTSRYEDSASDGKYFSDKVGSTPSVTGGYEISTGLGAASSYAIGAISLRPADPNELRVVASEQWTGSFDTAGTPVSNLFDVGSAENRVLYVHVAWDSSWLRSIGDAGVTYDGVALTPIDGGGQSQGNGRTRLYRLVAPASGRHPLQVDPGTADAVGPYIITAIALSGANQTTAEAGFTVSVGADTTPPYETSLIVPSDYRARALVFHTISSDDAAGLGTASGFTQLEAGEIDRWRVIAGDETGSPSVATSVTWTPYIQYSMSMGISVQPLPSIPATVTVTVMPGGGGDYVSLAAALSGEARNLRELHEICRIECYAGIDTAAAAVTGFTTDATHYVQIVAASGAEAQMPYATSGVYRLEAEDYFGALRIYDDYVRVERIQVDNPRSPTSGSENAGIAIEGTAVGETRIIGCSFRKSNGRNTTDVCAHINGLGLAIGHVLVAVNNVGYGHAFGIRANPQGAGYVVIRNNTFVDAWRYNFGLTLTASSGVSYIENNLGSGAVDGGDYYFNGAGNVINNNAASDASAQGENPRDNQTFTFVDAANHDYHLAEADTGARGFGLDLSGSGAFALSYDFDGDARGAVWDIGADQYVTSAVPENPEVDAAVEVGADGVATIRITGQVDVGIEAGATDTGTARWSGQAEVGIESGSMGNVVARMSGALDAALEASSTGAVGLSVRGNAAVAVDTGVDGALRGVLSGVTDSGLEVGSSSVTIAVVRGQVSGAVELATSGSARAIVLGASDSGLELAVTASGDVIEPPTETSTIEAAVEVGVSGVGTVRARGTVNGAAEMGGTSTATARMTASGSASVELTSGVAATARLYGVSNSAVETGSSGAAVATIRATGSSGLDIGADLRAAMTVRGVLESAVETGSSLLGTVTLYGVVEAAVEAGSAGRNTADAVAGVAPLRVTFDLVTSRVTFTEVIARADLSM